MKSYAFLFWAYTIVWGGLVTYLVFLLVRLRKVEGRLDWLERKVRPQDGQKSIGS